MESNKEIKSFDDFWPAYLREHRDAGSRAAHFIGLGLSAALAVALLSCGMVFFLVLAVVPAQVGAYMGHKLSPRKDRGSEEYPAWAARAEMKMFRLFLTGRLGD